MNEHKSSILIVDDEPSMRETAQMLLKDKYQVYTAKNGKEAIDIVKKKNLDLVLLDVRMPEMDGIGVLEQIKGIDESIDVIMITAVLTVNTAVAAIKKGAYDYLTKPFDIAALEELIKKTMEKRKLVKENLFLKSIVSEEHFFEKIIGKSKNMKEVFQLVRDAAKGNSTILISGESGTGKELVARAIHSQSHRKNNLFVTINCAAIPENLLESELFGYEKGAFTGAFERKIGKFEVADGGTLFLDEISSLPKFMQGKLLRTLQEKEIERIGNPKPIKIDARIIAATNRDLKEEVKKNKFREDLFYRLNVIPILLPPLRERKDDIPLLINHFLEKFNKLLQKKIKGLTKAALRAFESYDWPGNIRELENLIERLVVLGKSDLIDVDVLPPEISGKNQTENLSDLPLKEATLKFEAAFIQKVVEKAGGNKTKAAKMLGVHRNTLLQIERKNRQENS
ncbi:MAG: sigma-54 dependent transcriptional regulator [Candidatus Saganbacteria bacterium]|nr:sigma-54 dependent transcriptional regulator [Candidatus Saganbacteria bacterium]